MVYAPGMLLGAFFVLYCFYDWYYGDDDKPFEWFDLVLPFHWLWHQTYFHSKASRRRNVKYIKRNSALALFGGYIGWGITDGILRLL